MSEPMDALLQQTAISLIFSGSGNFKPVLSKSTRWISWVTSIGPTTCTYCSDQNGKIFDKQQPPAIEPPAHDHCHCLLKILLSILAGTATIESTAGADYWIKHFQSLPKNYVTKDNAEKNDGIIVKGI